MKKTLIFEAQKRDFMTKREEKLKKKLIALLRDDGKGHKHAKFAERLKDFLIKIVPLGEEPGTAAISWEDGIIYINEGFLDNPSTFFQLNVLMRHELAHHLMQHQIRMMRTFINKYGDEGAAHLSMSQSLHEIINIIEDFEISNERYTREDKEIVRKMMLNGKLIGGLVTEDHEKDWQQLSLGEMYDRLLDAIDKMREAITAMWNQDPNGPKIENNLINTNGVGLYFYSKTDGPSNIFGSLDRFIANKALYHFFPMDRQGRPCMLNFSSFPEMLQKIFIKIYEEFLENKSNITYTKQQIRDMIKEIGHSKPTQFTDVLNPVTGEVIFILYTPEEKLIAIDSLKLIIPMLEEYQTWFDKVVRVLSDNKYSDEDIAKVVAAMNA